MTDTHGARASRPSPGRRGTSPALPYSHMKICYAILHYDRAFPEPHSYLARTPIHREIPREIARLGHQAEIVHLFPCDADFEKDGVHHHFIASGPVERSLSRAAGALLGRDPAFYEPALGAARAIRASRPDLIHFHGITLHWNLLLLLCLLGKERPPLVLHFHGGYPARNRLARAVQRICFRQASRLLFTTRAHAEPFLKAGVLDNLDRVEELMETSSSFVLRSREASRRETGMEGDPVFLWAGRLDPIKDPFTALRGFEQIATIRPGAQLYMYYLTDEMLPQLREFVEERPALASRVHFRGRAAFEEMEAIYNSADFLLQGSLREFSGCAVLEAMACGVIPVVTDIPSFRAMTDGGRYGVLFPPGDAGAMTRGVLSIAPGGHPRALLGRACPLRCRPQLSCSCPATGRHLPDGDAGEGRAVSQDYPGRHAEVSQDDRRREAAPTMAVAPYPDRGREAAPTRNHSVQTLARLYSLALWALAALLGIRLALFLPGAVSRISNGFAAHYTASRLLLEGEPVARFYDDAWFAARIGEIAGPVYDLFRPNLPTASLLLLPVAGLEYLPARVIWTALSLAILAATVAFVMGQLRLRGPWIPACLAGLLLFQPLYEHLNQGQNYLVLIGLLAATWHGYRREMPALAGVSLGLLLGLKLLGGYLVLLFLLERRWKVLAWAGGAAAAVAAASLPWIGVEAWLAYVGEFPGFLRQPGMAVTAHQTQAGFVQHMLVYDPQFNSAPLVDAPALASVLVPAAFAAVLGAGLLAARMARGSDLAFALMVLANLILGPLSADYQYVVVLLSIVILLAWARERNSPWVWLAFGLGSVLIAADLPYRSPRLAEGAWSLLAYPKLYGAWLLYGLAVWGCWREG